MRDLLYIYKQRCVPLTKQLSSHLMEETLMGHVCTENAQPGSLFHTGGIPAAEQRVKKEAVPAILI